MTGSTATPAHAFEQQYAGVAKRAIDAEALVSAAINPISLRTTFANNPVAAQLKMVARMIAARAAFSQRRQIFFVQSGGWDFHDNLNTDQALRLKALGDALQSFYNATVELGVANEVSTFTASEFGRALQSNGRGSDHGWGGHQFVIGGAVQGQRIVGQFPRVALGGPEDAGQGRLIPSTPVDALAASLGRWMGVSNTDLSQALPNLSRFSAADLGLFAS